MLIAAALSVSVSPAAQAQIEGSREGSRGGSWESGADPAMSYEERMRIQEQEKRQRQLEREEAYLQRLEDLGVGNNNGGDSSNSGDKSEDDAEDADVKGDAGEKEDSKDSEDSGQGDPAEVNGDWAEPMEGALGSVSSGYKSPDRPGHRGIDIAKPDKTPIYAVTDGTVVQSGPATGFGSWIVIDHQIDGKKYSTVYGHMRAEDLLVNVGDVVKAGDHISNEGSEGESTGPHLHFEVWDGGRLTGGTEIDPTDWAGRGGK